jgi:hypothetical protein
MRLRVCVYGEDVLWSAYWAALAQIILIIDSINKAIIVSTSGSFASLELVGQSSGYQVVMVFDFQTLTREASPQLLPLVGFF